MWVFRYTHTRRTVLHTILPPKAGTLCTSMIPVQLIDTLFENLNNTFISKGIPVIITEYGSVTKIIDKDWYLNNEEEVAKLASYYISTAEKYGIPCVWWDNGYHTSGNELFGLFDRKNLSWYSPKVVEAIMDSLTD